MARRRQLYEGKAKILFEGPEPGTLVQYFKDDATAFNAQKKGIITGKGVLNNRISEYLMLRLAEIDTGMRRSGFVPVSAAHIARQAVDFYLPAAELKAITLSYRG